MSFSSFFLVWEVGFGEQNETNFKVKLKCVL